MAYTGRGAWSPVGGTLRKDRTTGTTVPGPYYMRPSKGVLAPGVVADNVLLSGGTPDLNEHAVWYGVLAVKKALVESGHAQSDAVILNGRYGTGVAAAVRAFQTDAALTADGAVGPVTARALFRPLVQQYGRLRQTDWTVACGLVTNESAWDPGAVGKVDSNDHGLCQLNAPSQGMTLEQSFDPLTAIDRLYRIMDENLARFGDVEDSVASYNLGKAGASLWIAEGRPQWFIPWSQRDDPDAKPRDVWAYIERIITAC